MNKLNVLDMLDMRIREVRSTRDRAAAEHAPMIRNRASGEIAGLQLARALLVGEVLPE